MIILLLGTLLACSTPEGPSPPATEPAPTTPTDSEPTADSSTPTPEPELPRQCGYVDWIVRYGSIGVDRAWQAAATPDGGVVLVGEFYGSITFAEGEPNETSFSGPSAEGFVTKYSADGTVEWVVQFGGLGWQRVTHVATTADGTLAIGAVSDSVATISKSDGTGDLQVPYRGGGADADVVAAVFDATGSPIWATSMGGAGMDLAGGVARTQDGAVYVHGSNDGDGIEFGPVGSGLWLDNLGEEENSFVARFEPDGSVAWTRSIAGQHDQQAAGLALSSAGDVVAVGNFRTDIVFSEGQPDAVTVTPDFAHAGALLNYLAAYAPDGSLAWTRTPGNLDAVDTPEAIVAAGDQLVMAGTSGSYAVFGEGEPNEYTFPAEFTEYLAAFDTDGSLAWVQLNPTDTGNGLAVGPGGERVVAGAITFEYSMGVDMDGHLVEGDAGSTQDPYVAVWDADGALQCAWIFEDDEASNPFPEARAVAFDGDGGLWVAGSFKGRLRAEPGTPHETVLQSAGNSDIFLARIVPTQPKQATPTEQP